MMERWKNLITLQGNNRKLAGKSHLMLMEFTRKNGWKTHGQTEVVAVTKMGFSRTREVSH